MGLKCLLVAVLFMSPCVFSRDCKRILDNQTTNICNECIRCGGKWCNVISEDMDLQCVGPTSNDDWCPSHQETLPNPKTNTSGGTYFDPVYVEKRAFVGSTNYVTITIHLPPGVKSAPVPKIVDSTQPSTPNVTIEATTKKDGSILVTLITEFGPDFCSPNSTMFEYVSVTVGLRGVSEEVRVKYQVPCACGCSDRVEKNSLLCSGLGDLTCGVCRCPEDRVGSRCERKKCLDRGDNPPSCTSPSNPTMKECYGNGRCNKCNECECFMDSDIEGSQYFDPDNYCEDICSATNKCTECLKDNEPGNCDQCDTAYVFIEKAKNNATEERDLDRRMWVHCNVTLDCGLVQYAAMQTDGVKHVMILKSCEGIYLGSAAGTGITVPVVSTLVAVAVMMAAAGVGYMVWKGKGAAPLPLTSPEYTNIDAEDCTGVNPLYKPPTSSFKNPMYGKP